MNNVIVFDRDAVLNLAIKTNKELEHLPSLTHLYDRSIHRDGQMLNTDGDPFDYHDENSKPSSQNVDLTLVPSCLILNSNLAGVFLSSNAKPASYRQQHSLIFAQGINPDIDNQWRSTQVKKLSSKPIEEAILTRDIVDALRGNKLPLRLLVDDRSITIMNNTQQ